MLFHNIAPKTLSKLTLRSRSDNWDYLRPPGSPVSPGQSSPSLRKKAITKIEKIHEILICCFLQSVLASSSADSLLQNGIARPSPPMSPGQRRKTYEGSANLKVDTWQCLIRNRNCSSSLCVFKATNQS